MFNRKIKTTFLLFLFVWIFISACKKNTFIEPQEFGFEYYPLSNSQVFIYAVDSVVFNDFNNSVDSFRFELRDSVVSTFQDASGAAGFILERSKRTATNPWVFQRNIVRVRKNTLAEELKNNIRIVPLVFPAQLNRKWDGNAFNNLGTKEFEITKFEESLSIGGTSFPLTLEVTQQNQSNLIREDKSTEVYAKEVGLVRSELVAVDKNINTGQITRGLRYLQRIKSLKK